MPFTALRPGDPLIPVQAQLRRALARSGVRTSPGGRGYRVIPQDYREAIDAAAAALAADPRTAKAHALLEASAAAEDATRPPVGPSASEASGSRAGLFATEEQRERGTAIHRLMAKALSGADGDPGKNHGNPLYGELDECLGHPLYGEHVAAGLDFLECSGLRPLAVEVPLFYAFDGFNAYGTADLIAWSTERRAVAVVDWSATVAYREKLRQVAAYMAALWGLTHSLPGVPVLPVALGYVVGLGQPFADRLATCVRPCAPADVQNYFTSMVGLE